MKNGLRVWTKETPASEPVYAYVPNPAAAKELLALHAYAASGPEVLEEYHTDDFGGRESDWWEWESGHGKNIHEWEPGSE